LDSAPGDILNVYKSVLEEKELPGVGAAIRWDDWPEQSKKYDYEIAFFTLDAQKFMYQGRAYYYQNAAVDSTFCMYRKTHVLSRDTSSNKARMLPPLAIRHLDFYLDPLAFTEDYKYYHNIARASGVNHIYQSTI
jgi:hypothetical protein